VERAYDRFSGGFVEPNAVKALLASQGIAKRPAYALLVGDDTYDPRDFSGTGGVSFIPSLLGWDGQFGRVPSENRYADQDGDSRPDLAIGRLPVNTAAEADLMVQKIAAGDALGAGRPVLAVDNPGPDDLSFRSEAQSIARFLNLRPVWADVGAQGVPQARQTILDTIQAGATTASYFGHGGQSYWADEHLLDPADLAALEGSGSLTVVLAWTCNAQWYQNHLEPSMGEDLLLVPGGGAAAAFGPAGMTAPVLQSSLYSRLYPNLSAGMTLGEAIRRAKAGAVAADLAALPIVEGFNLLGDPALALPGYTLSR
jgi:Peptidase family C25